MFGIYYQNSHVSDVGTHDAIGSKIGLVILFTTKLQVFLFELDEVTCARVVYNSSPALCHTKIIMTYGIIK
jgi:hypothetical protein